MTWIVIPNWAKFQSYSEAPTWIKVYTDLAHRDEWFALSAAARGLLVSCWIEYALAGGVLEHAQLQRRSGLRARAEDFESLIHAGFLEFSEKKPSRARARERREEEELPLSPREAGINPRAKGTNPRAVAKRDLPRRKAEAWIDNGLAAQVPQEHLAHVIQDEFGINDRTLLQVLCERAKTQGSL